MIDHRSQESINYAEKIISQAPEDIQIIVFSNFYDDHSTRPLIPEPLVYYLKRFSYVAGSLKTNSGLKELFNWLQLPLLSTKRKVYSTLFRFSDESLRSFQISSFNNSKRYITNESLRKYFPEEDSKVGLKSPVFQPSQNIPEIKESKIFKLIQEENNEEESQSDEESQNPMPILYRKSDIKEENEESFWSDEENEEKIDFIPMPAQEQEHKPNPLVQASKTTAEQAAIQQRLRHQIEASKEADRKPPDNCQNEQNQKTIQNQSMQQRDEVVQVTDDDFFEPTEKNKKENASPKPNPLVVSSSTSAQQRAVQQRLQQRLNSQTVQSDNHSTSSANAPSPVKKTIIRKRVRKVVHH
ncbi:hypothetical protein GPJ56_003053 [Histomonas meleagridis]|uniref:uncharacterized protein n=1 Tax=Histomonas meleagridis TaxID=135588 RepID=UPI003559F5EB|nr:hypothetical protein GPJ56_003053 [Histomonas meleagridis]KAH0805173.1 hypothetical protein GO595_002118 [Histomonas meleagridis]